MEFSNIEYIYIIFQWKSFQQHLQFTSLNVEVLFEVWAETSDIHGGDGMMTSFVIILMMTMSMMLWWWW